MPPILYSSFRTVKGRKLPARQGRPTWCRVSSPLAPDEKTGHRVIPHHAHQCAGGSGDPPDRLMLIDRESNADIGKQADAAHNIEGQEPSQDGETFQSLVAIGEEI